MAVWTGNDLDRVGAAEELEIASLRQDGTLRKSRTIWVVRVGDEIYVRSVNGRSSDWFRGVLTRHEGRIQAGGVEKDATFIEETDPGLNERINGAYREKYRRQPKEYVDACLTPQARAATIRIVPRD